MSQCSFFLEYQKSNDKRRWQLQQELVEVEDALALLDDHVDNQFAKLPGKVRNAAKSITESRQEDNHNYATIAGGIVFGRLLRTAGTLINTPTITGAVALTLLGRNIGSNAYAASRAVNVSLYLSKFI